MKWEFYCVIFGLVDKMWENVEKRMSGFFFNGTTVAKLDEKGRFVLPQEKRYGLVEEGKCQFFIGLGLGGCLAIYKKSIIEKIVEKFRQNQHVTKFQKFFTLFFSTLHETECDKIGRISLPDTLCEAVGIKKEIVVAGVLDKIELWPKNVYDANLKALISGTSHDMNLAQMTEAAFGLLQDDEGETDASTAQAAVSSAMNPLYAP